MNWCAINDDYNSAIIAAEDLAISQYNKQCNQPLKNETKEVYVEENIIEDDNISHILEIDVRSNKKYNPLEIIQLQIKVITNLIKHYKLNRLENIELYYSTLEWVCGTSEYLSQLIKQPINRNKTNTLMRSSYKFCNKKGDCQNQYGFLFGHKSKPCMNDHYVHNKIVSDIDNLLNYIKKNINIPDQKINLEMEVRKGIETINYVINHMNQELSSFMLYFKDNTNQKSKYTIKDFYRYYKH